METQADSRVTLYPDGKYRWVYEVPMLKNPSILIDVYKVLGISFGIVWLFNVLIISDLPNRLGRAIKKRLASFPVISLWKKTVLST